MPIMALSANDVNEFGCIAGLFRQIFRLTRCCPPGIMLAAVSKKPGDVAQWIRASPCEGEGRWFESNRPLQEL